MYAFIDFQVQVRQRDERAVTLGEVNCLDHSGHEHLHEIAFRLNRRDAEDAEKT